MIVDGRSIAHEIYDALSVSVKEMKESPTLSVIVCAPNFETQKYLSLKRRKAAEIGIRVNVIELLPEATTRDAVKTIKKCTKHSDGIVVQLPFPEYIDRNAIVAAIPSSHDIDALNGKTTKVHSPVVGAMQEILKKYNVAIQDKNVVVVGEGMLVGKPASRWLKQEGAHVEVITKHARGNIGMLQYADIIVLGAGAPEFLRPEMIKKGVVILDAGTSEDAGELKGDAHPACGEKASLFTPVPGGIGPITVAVLFRNLLTLLSER